jgi:YggT family protein
MFVFGHLFTTLAKLLHFIFQLAIILFIVRAVMSWFQPDTRQPVIAFIYKITDPVLYRIRRVIPSAGTIDISPLIVIIICWFLDSFLVSSLADIGYQMLK